MNKLSTGKASILVLSAVFAVAAFFLGKSLTPVFADSPEKIRICHAKPADTAANGWVSINVSKKAVVSNSSKHSSEHDADIIPTFTYTFDGGGTYGGKNWDAAGQAVWNNSCKSESSTPTPTASPTPSPTPTATPCDDDCSSPTPTPTPSPTPTATPFDACPNLDGVQDSVPDGYDVDEKDNCVPEPTPTPTATTNNGDICANIDGVQTSVPEGMHLSGAYNNQCVSFSQPGVPTPPPATGQVLGTSTMAGTGSFEESLYLAIMGLGATLTAFGAKKAKKAFKVAR